MHAPEFRDRSADSEMFLPPLPPTFDAALRDVNARAPRFRLAAAERLAAAGETEVGQALEALQVLLRDEFGPIRAAAAVGLGELAPPGDEALLSVLREALRDEHAEVRQAALASAARIDASPKWLKTHLKADGPALRFAAVVALAEHCPDVASDAIAPLAEDPDEGVRAAAVRCLGRLPDGTRWANRIADRLLDSSDVSIEAAIALARIGDDRGERQLAEALRHPGYAIEAAESLGSLPAGPVGIEALAYHAGRFFGSLLIKAAAGAALARVGDARGIDALNRVLRARRADGRDYALAAVAELRLHTLLPALQRLVDKLRGADPRLLADALDALRNEGAVAEAAKEARNLLQRRYGALLEQS